MNDSEINIIGNNIFSFIKKELKILYYNKNIDITMPYCNTIAICYYIDKIKLKNKDTQYIIKRIVEKYKIISTVYFNQESDNLGSILELRIKNKNLIRIEKLNIIFE